MSPELTAQSLTVNLRPRFQVFERPLAAIHTPEFRTWFNQSKVVSADGIPLVVYHGTSKNFSAFDPSKSKTTGIFFSAKPDYANIVAELEGARDEGGAQVLPVYLRIVNPLYVAAKDFSRAITKLASDLGHDGLVTLDEEGNFSQLTVFSSNQIKSAIGNNGSFDPLDPRISR